MGFLDPYIWLVIAVPCVPANWLFLCSCVLKFRTDCNSMILVRGSVMFWLQRFNTHCFHRQMWFGRGIICFGTVWNVPPYPLKSERGIKHCSYTFMFALVSAKVSLLMSFLSAYECNLVAALTDYMFPDWVAITRSCLVTRLEGLVIPVCLKPQEQAEAWFATWRRFMIGCFFLFC